ncbi:MAG: glycosyltransferase family 2 protein [Candidatus Binataceae bacterium]
MSQITTIIPTYRRPKLLQRAIRSVLAQTYSDFEISIFDNASDDDTAAAVRELARYDARIKYHCHSENIGIIRNFGYGMKRVSSPFFNLLSDDDILLPNFFETAIRSFVSNPEAMLFVGGLIETDLHGHIQNVPFRGWSIGLHQPPELFFKMLSSGPNTWTSMLWRKELHFTLDGLDEEVGLSADLDFELKALSRYPAVIDNELCAIFVVHPESASEKRLSATAFAKAMVRMVENIARDSVQEPLVRSRMLAAMNSRFRDIAFVRARVAAMRGLTTEALEVARILEERFCAPSHAQCIRLLARQSCLGTLSRVAVNFLRAPRRAVRAAITAQRFRPFSSIVRNSTLMGLDDQVSPWAGGPSL